VRWRDVWHNHDVGRQLFLLLVGMLFVPSTNAPPSDASARGHYSAPIRYDGRFTLVRLRWGADLHPPSRFSLQDAWSHDYPRAERDLSAVIRGLTYLDVHDDGNEILMLDDPELFKYPIALMWKAGLWKLGDREAHSFRAYLLKGGFAIFDDVDGATQWANFETQMQRVLPGGRLLRLDASHPIFNAFFPIEDSNVVVRPMSNARPSHYGIFEDNDPARRLLVVVNYGNELPEYGGRSGQALFAMDASNDAYRLAVNYMIYGLSH
jgi:hypothetical protein